MKLCKDCKHFERIGRDAGFCEHPKADFNVVDGSPTTYCFQARGEIMSTAKTICGIDAKLFEQAEPKPYRIVLTVIPAERPSLWQRIFGR
ncbi:hypothetical protein F0160_22615 [Paraburkholderia sp. JPY303]|uniref:hypothetical protein n=1 Tax=Paraburkholderia atlantica TaxID=2654982 RepID=UPI001590CCFF|nr:hypothetical protein [Paraburkholderia atlantica]NUY33281.1 hypothetical protein [Paraburkholderia atlantica]